nr:hypothetical protein [uncultured Massilia sp.]
MTITATLGIFASPNLRRVRREEVAKPTIQKPDPYPLLMAFWVDYMHTNDRDLGAGGMKLATDAEPDVNVHDAQRKDDMKMGEAVNACVDSLAVLQRAAIYRSQGLATAWRVGASNYETVLLRAREELEEKLKKNLATRIYFS